MYSAYGGRVGAAIGSVLYFIAIVISELHPQIEATPPASLAKLKVKQTLFLALWPCN